MSVIFFYAAVNKLALKSHKNYIWANRVLHVWYGIETALLNPIVKERIAGLDLEEIKGQKGSHVENIVIYMRRITVDDLLPDVETRKFERHVEKWGVAGHWRECSSGKKIWVRPYEKGRKRNQKSENQKLRERIVITRDVGQVPAQ